MAETSLWLCIGLGVVLTESCEEWNFSTSCCPNITGRLELCRGECLEYGGPEGQTQMTNGEQADQRTQQAIEKNRLQNVAVPLHLKRSWRSLDQNLEILFLGLYFIGTMNK